jgi:hypothetical protein
MRAMGSRPARIQQIDLHGRSVEEALIAFVSAYNSLVHERRDDGLRVIHG